MEKYYVYVFFKPDENKTPFYVGIGSVYADGRERIDYHFLYAKNPKHQANKLFYNTLKKILDNNQQPIVEKVAENLSIDNASELEKKLIQLYGRKVDKTGTLCNITDGGEGWSGEQPHKWKKVVQLDLHGNLINTWESIKQAALETESSRNDISSVCRGVRKTHNGYIWLFLDDYENNFETEIKLRTTFYQTQSKITYQYDLKGNLLKIWDNAKQAAETLGLHRSTISLCCQGKQRQTGGFIWKYAE
jgi:NUMOD1 domain